MPDLAVAVRKIMKKYFPTIAGIVLGLLFVMASVMFFLKLGPKPEFPEGSPIAHFMVAFGPTGYMHFVKVFELTGGILVAIPRTRNVGLLLLGPVIVNIIAFHIFITHGKDLLNPMLVAIVLLALYLLWVGRKQFAGLVCSAQNERVADAH
jgi:putative oxidoreductase